MPRRDSKRRQSSATLEHGPTAPAAGTEEPSLWKTWVAIPLGLAEEEPHAEHVEGNRTDSPEPQEGTASQAQPPVSNGDTAAAHANGDSKPGTTSRQESSQGGWPFPDPLKLMGLTRTKSAPHMDSRANSRQGTHDSAGQTLHRTGTNVDGERPRQVPGTPASGRGWAVLRNRLRAGSHIGFGKHDNKRKPAAESSTAAEIDISEELMAGPLAVLALRMHFERDEDNHRRVPVFLQHVKIRVSDSVHPLHGTHAVFRIEVRTG